MFVARSRILLCLLAAGLTLGCDNAAAPADRTTVFVSILPQRYFVQRIAGDRVRVEALVAKGGSEHGYEPTPQQLVALSSAKLFFSIGVGVEAGLLPRLAEIAPKLRIVDTRQGVPPRSFAAHEQHSCDDHDHEGHSHGEGAPDPHVWLDPLLVKTQAANICDALCEIDPAGAESYRKNLAAFQAELDALHAEIEARLTPFRGRDILVFHPSYGYFCDRYGLRQIPVEVEGKEPTARQLANVTERAKASGTTTVFHQPQFAGGPAQTLARLLGGKAVSVDPLAEDFVTNLRDIAEKIAAALAEPRASRP
jgi:zinc transport system substrate-binding protein